MASYGIIYQFSFDSQNGCDTDIFILKKNYSGIRYTRALGRAPVLKREHNGCVFGTSLELYAECRTDGEFAQLYTSSADEFKVEVYRHQQLVWTGFVSPELYSEPDIAPPYDVQIIATDGLGELKSHDFQTGGMATVTGMIRSMLTFTGLDLEYRLASSIETFNGTYWSGKNGLGYVMLDLSYMNGKSCYDVLQSLLESFHAGITQHNGQWLIFRESDFIGLASEAGLPVTDTSGASKGVTPITGFGSVDRYAWWPVGQLSTVIEPAKRKVSFRSERHYKPSVFVNSEMSEDAGWEKTLDVTYDSDEAAYLLPKEGSTIVQNVDFYSGVAYRLALHVSARSVGTGEAVQSLGIMIKIASQDASGDSVRYLVKKTTPAGQEYYAWEIVEEGIEYQLPSPFEAGTSADAESIDIVIPLYDNRKPNVSTSSWIYAKGVEVSIYNPDGVHGIYVYECVLAKYEQPKGWEIEGNIGNDAREADEDVELAIADASLVEAAADVFGYGIPVDAEVEGRITSWRTGIHPESSYFSLMVKSYAQKVALPRMRYEGVLNVPATDVILPALFSRDGTYYFPETYAFDLLNDELRVSMTSIPAADVTITSEKVTEIKDAGGITPSGGGSSSGGSSGGGAADITIDTEMSDTSVNAVQNKVIKKYVDDAVAKAGAGAVIFDATCSTDPWNLNQLQTETTIEEMAEAINNGSPIYMRFGSGLVSVANAELYDNGDVSLYVHLVDPEDVISRTIHTYSDGEDWYWESFNNPMGGGGEVDTAMSATSENAVQNKVIKAYVDKAEMNAYNNAFDDSVAASTHYTNTQVAKKAGAFYVEPSTNLFVIFTTEEAKAAYISSGDESGVLGKFALGGGGTSETSYRMTINGLQSSYGYTTSSETMPITCTFKSQVKYAGEDSYSDFAEDAVFTVSAFKNGGWVELASKIVSNGATFSLDLKPYMATGSNSLKVTAVGIISGASDTKGITVNVSSLSLTPFNFNWWTPFIEGQSYGLGGLKILGSLSKKLHIKVTGSGYSREYTESIGTEQHDEVAYKFNNLVHPSSSGVYKVELWLTADSGELQTETLSYNIMCIASEDVSSKKLICLNDVATELQNYTENKLFAYAVYNGGALNASPSFKVVADGKTIVNGEYSVNTGVANTFSTSFAIASSASAIPVTATATYGNTITKTFTLDNEASFAPVSGYTFLMDAATRSNSDAYRNYFINEANQEKIYTSWTDMAWVDGMDGWTTDAQGNKCLLVPAMSRASVNLTPMKGVSTFALEMLYKVANVADFDEDIITIATNTASSWMGLKIKPTNICLHSQTLGVDDLKQSYNTQEDTLVHLMVTVITEQDNGIGNIAIIYVNGVKKCSFEWSAGDTFAHSGELELGSDTADLYLYRMRMYNVAFSWPQVMQNYISSLHTISERVNVNRKEESVLDDSNRISYDKVYGVYNTFIVELPKGASLPNAITNPSNGAVEGTNLYIDIVQNRNCSIQGEFLNVPLEGQGTTAMTYYRWNLRSKTSSAYDKFRITAKKNVASSMQSHKRGATALYNDLNLAIVGANEANGRVAVYQYPVYGFLKIENEAQAGTYIYDFIGLYTIGPDKGDKSTFGYDNEAYEDTLIHMEGTDHSPRGVGMDYPWEQMTVGINDDGDAFIGPKNSSGGLAEEAWEIGACGDKETASAMKTYLNAEFAPAYTLDYECTPLIVGLPSGTSIETINANVASFRAETADYGFSKGDCLVYIIGEYDVYYFDVITEQYKKDGRKIYEGLSAYGFSTTALASASDKTAYIRQYRRLRYRAEMGGYWHLNDSLFHACFLDLIGATDNEKKNSYPYKFGTLASGSRWRWRQDDLDTIFDVNNQGSADKKYSIMNTDKQGSTMIYKGNTSYHWRCIRQYYPDELKKMMQTIMDKMVSLCPAGYGSSKIERLVGCIRHYFWDYAQDYFTGGAYNADAKWTYEDTWVLWKQNSTINAVHPLQQSLGSHYEAEKAWVTLRMLFLASMNEWGAFVDYVDRSAGQVSFRQGGDFTFTLTPAIDMRPSVIQGANSKKIHASGRVLAGNEVPISTTADTSADTMVYIQGADWLKDIGDFSKAKIGSSSQDFAVTSKRLQKLKIGDATAGYVETNIDGLTIGYCPSLMEVEARNVTTLVKEVDLSQCPRLRRAYFGGTKVPAITLADGSKVTALDLPSTIQRMKLIKLPLLRTSGLTYTDLNNLTYLWVEDNAYLDGYDMLKTALEGGSPLNNIRVIGFNKTATAEDTDFLLELANGEYHGITPTGTADNTIPPVLVGTVNYNTIDGDVYDALKAAYGNNLTINYNKLTAFIKFVDPAVLEVLLAKGVDKDGDGGITREEAEAVTTIGEWFTGNTAIVSFDELQYFTGLTAVNSDAFKDCSALASINLVNVTEIAAYAFIRCSSLKVVNAPISVVNKLSFKGCSAIESFDFSRVTSIALGAFVSALSSIDLICPALTSVTGAAFYGSGVKRVLDMGSVTTFPYSSDNEQTGGVFANSPNLELAILPSTTAELRSTFENCKALRVCIVKATTPPTHNGYVFSGASALEVIYVPDTSVDAYKVANNWKNHSSIIKGISSLATDNPTLYAEIEEYL